MSLLPSVAATIGQTPLVALDRLARGLPGRILAKLETANPGGSVKDRIALAIIEAAERDGRLKSGGTVVELTSGNTGIALAIVCAVKDYRMVAVMSEGNTVERRRMLEAVGAEVVLVPQVARPWPGQVSGADLEKVEEKTRELVKRLKAFRPDQFLNPDNVAAALTLARRAKPGTTIVTVIADTGLKYLSTDLFPF
ncbi:MAG: PLP-dependent cysteine synthase family protein [Candidatus Methylomirabilales bacterium]